MLIKWSYRSPNIGPKMVIIFWTRSRVSFKHVFLVSVLGVTLTPYHSNICLIEVSNQFKRVSNLIYSLILLAFSISFYKKSNWKKSCRGLALYLYPGSFCDKSPVPIESFVCDWIGILANECYFSMLSLLYNIRAVELGAWWYFFFFSSKKLQAELQNVISGSRSSLNIGWAMVNSPDCFGWHLHRSSYPEIFHPQMSQMQAGSRWVLQLLHDMPPTDCKEHQ